MAVGVVGLEAFKEAWSLGNQPPLISLEDLVHVACYSMYSRSWLTTVNFLSPLLPPHLPPLMHIAYSQMYTHTGVKRVTLVKDQDKGIGCTIKNAAGHILVNRIIEDGPIAQTGVLRPGVSTITFNSWGKSLIVLSWFRWILHSESTLVHNSPDCGNHKSG